MQPLSYTWESLVLHWTTPPSPSGGKRDGPNPMLLLADHARARAVREQCPNSSETLPRSGELAPHGRPAVTSIGSPELGFIHHARVTHGGVSPELGPPRAKSNLNNLKLPPLGGGTACVIRRKRGGHLGTLRFPAHSCTNTHFRVTQYLCVPYWASRVHQG